MDIASEYRYRNPVVGDRRPRDRHLPVGRDRRHAGRDAPRARARREGARRHEHHGLARPRATPTACSSRAPASRSASRPRRPSSRQVAAMYLLGAASSRSCAARSSPRRAPSSVDELQRAAAPASTSCSSTVGRAGRADRRATGSDAELLPLPRPPHRPAGVPRGRAQAQGDLLHPDRRLRGGRDEARPDRAARRGARRSCAWPPTRRCSTRCSRTSPRCGRAAPT